MRSKSQVEIPGFSDYEAFRKRELGIDAEQPHRIKYKPLARS